MTRDDFTVVDNFVFVKTCKKLVETDGKCGYIVCRSNCPFSRMNSTDGKSCEGKYRSDNKNVIINNAKEFIKLYEGGN